MTSKAELSHTLKLFAKEIERKLAESYPYEVVDMMMHKLRSVLDDLNYATHRKSVAVFLSPVFQKVIYLDISVERKMIIDDAFSIRDLVLDQQQQLQYLVLSLDGSHCQVFHFDGSSFARIMTDATASYQEIMQEWAASVSNITDVSSRRETAMHKFLLRIDTSLTVLLNAYKLPLFAVGPDRLLGHFIKLTKNRDAVINVIYHDPPASLSRLSNIIAPYLTKWAKLIDKQLLRKIDMAIKRKRLAFGIRDVAAAAKENKIDQLIVEKSFRGSTGTSNNVIPIRASFYDAHVQMKDVVDNIIGKVLEYSGDVAFVENDVLATYGRIAAIKRY